MYHKAFLGERVEAEAATNTQRAHCSLIVCLHNKSNVSREIIYTRGCDKEMNHQFAQLYVFLHCVYYVSVLVPAGCAYIMIFACVFSMIARQYACLFSHVWP